jgi:hypothetical protein
VYSAVTTAEQRADPLGQLLALLGFGGDAAGGVGLVVVGVDDVAQHHRRDKEPVNQDSDFPPGSGRTYSGSSGMRMDSRHLQHTSSLLTRCGIARISTFIFGLYILAVSMIEAGQVTWLAFSAMSGRPNASHCSIGGYRT